MKIVINEELKAKIIAATYEHGTITLSNFVHRINYFFNQHRLSYDDIWRASRALEKAGLLDIGVLKGQVLLKKKDSPSLEDQLNSISKADLVESGTNADEQINLLIKRAREYAIKKSSTPQERREGESFK